ncbi:hypothetical protein GCM10023257_02550 [Streptomyces hyderabadensis]|uniref:Uncharacterized protein n=1 Tax=Streptomyces hyderabadensis TaxID=598549 RepID=A0ABP9HGG9_9ACTN
MTAARRLPWSEQAAASGPSDRRAGAGQGSDRRAGTGQGHERSTVHGTAARDIRRPAPQQRPGPRHGHRPDRAGPGGAAFAPFPRGLFTGSASLSPRPPYYVTDRTGRTTMARLTAYATAPGPARPPGILTSALRG